MALGGSVGQDGSNPLHLAGRERCRQRGGSVRSETGPELERGALSSAGGSGWAGGRGAPGLRWGEEDAKLGAFS